MFYQSCSPIGEPEEMDLDSLEQARTAATSRMREQQQRNTSSGARNTLLAKLLEGSRDPDEEEAQEDEEDMEIWRLLPHLKSVPEKMLKKLDISAIFQLNSALAKESKNSEKLSISSRMAAYADQLVRTPAKVKAGEDDRNTVLHEGRFLGGASCSAQELWLQARKQIGAKGVKPLGNYELDSVGCGGSVTAKGWQTLHDPSSQDMKLKHFYLPNVSGSGLSTKKLNLEEGEETVTIGNSLREIADIEGYKGALNTFREAMSAALPWNRSSGAIVGFMVNSNYLQQDLGTNSRRTAILVEFTDYILSRNAMNWQNSQPFVSTDEMAHIWQNWKGKRASLFTADKPRQTDRKKKEPSRTDGVCKRYNTGTCNKQTEKECKTFFGTTLKHVCDKFVTGGGLCGKDHPRKDHK